MSLFNKNPEDEIFNLDVDGKQIVWRLKVYHPVLWKTMLQYISKNPQKLGGMAYSPDDGKAIYMRFTPRSKRRKIVEFATEDECKQFYDIFAIVVKGNAVMNVLDGGYVNNEAK